MTYHNRSGGEMRNDFLNPFSTDYEKWRTYEVRDMLKSNPYAFRPWWIRVYDCVSALDLANIELNRLYEVVPDRKMGDVDSIIDVVESLSDRLFGLMGE